MPDIAQNAPDWIKSWQQLNNYSGNVGLSNFDPNIFKYTPQEYQQAGINLIPVAGRTIKFEPTQWQAALDQARINLKLQSDQTALLAQQQSDAAQQNIQTVADQQATAIKQAAATAVGRRATILSRTSPLGITQSSGSTNLLGGTQLKDPLITLLGQ